MIQPARDVRGFMHAFGQQVPEAPKFPDRSLLELRVRMLREEVQEIEDSTDLVGLLDGVLDVMYVALGTALCAGITPGQIQAGFSQVHQSNLDKLWTAKQIENSRMLASEMVVEASSKNGKFIVRRPDGKVLKPPGHQGPQLGFVLQTP